MLQSLSSRRAHINEIRGDNDQNIEKNLHASYNLNHCVICRQNELNVNIREQLRCCGQKAICENCFDNVERIYRGRSCPVCRAQPFNTEGAQVVEGAIRNSNYSPFPTHMQSESESETSDNDLPNPNLFGSGYEIYNLEDFGEDEM